MTITLILFIICYIGIAATFYIIAKVLEFSRRELLLYSVVWPWFIIVTAGCALWDFKFPVD